MASGGGEREWKMVEVVHETVRVNGLNMHIATSGPVDGPIVLLLHGFPEIWYSWRYQIEFLSGKGYRAVAPDLRGYGDTDAPSEIDAYTCWHVVGDLVALIDVVDKGEEGKVFVVGHDWGAIIGWHLCLFRPDKVKAVVNMSVPFTRVDPTKNPVENFRALYGEDFYVCRFQEPGEIESEFEEIGTENFLKKVLTSTSRGPFSLPRDKAFWNPPNSLPPWLSEEDVQFYVANLEKKGFTGPINYYRNYNRNNELLAPWAGCKIQVPAKFIIGDQDMVYTLHGVKEYIFNGGLKEEVPLLDEPVLLQGIGHFVNQEAADKINEHIYKFIQNF